MNCSSLVAAWLLVLPSYAARQYPVEHLLPSGRIHGLSFSLDGSEILVSIDSGAGFRMHSVSTKTANGREIRTLRGGTALAMSYFPADNRILFNQDTSDRRRQLCVLELHGAERDLAPDARVARFAGWSADHHSLYVLTDFPATVRRVDASTYDSTILIRGDLHGTFKQMSPDGQWIGSDIAPSPSYRRISLLHISSKENQDLAVRPQLARYYIGSFDPESRWLYYLTDAGEDFLRVCRYSLSTGTHEDIERTNADIVFTSFSPKGKYRLSVVDREGRSELIVYETTTGNRVHLPEIPRGNINNVAVSASEQLLAFHLETDRSPANLYVCNLPKGTTKKLTDLRSRRLNEEDLVQSQAIRFRSFDGVSIPCLLFKPQQATAKRKAPALVWLHGGPTAQTRVDYSPPLQYLVNHGFVILAVNYRGSTGYGVTFSAADDKKHGHEPLEDCIEAKKYLATLPFVDPERIGAIGESYGGYLVLAALTFHSDVFKVGVDMFGVSNWIRAITDMDSGLPLGRNTLISEVGHPVKDRENLLAISPLFHADRIRCPLFVVQGAKDRKIAKEDTDALVSIVKTNGVPLEYLVLDNEGHGLAAGMDYLNVWRRIREFLERYL